MYIYIYSKNCFLALGFLVKLFVLNLFFFKLILRDAHSPNYVLLSQENVLIYLFIYLNDGKRHRKISYLLVHSSNAHSSQNGVQPKPGAWDSIQVSQSGGRSSNP